MTMPMVKSAAKPTRSRAAEGSANIALSMKLRRKADFEKALIMQYFKAIKLSRKAGHQVSFRVVVDPLAGAQTITPVEEQPPTQEDAFRWTSSVHRMKSFGRR